MLLSWDRGSRSGKGYAISFVGSGDVGCQYSTFSSLFRSFFVPTVWWLGFNLTVLCSFKARSDSPSFQNCCLTGIHDFVTIGIFCTKTLTLLLVKLFETLKFKPLRGLQVCGSCDNTSPQSFN